MGRTGVLRTARNTRELLSPHASAVGAPPASPGMLRPARSWAATERIPIL